MFELKYFYNYYYCLAEIMKDMADKTRRNMIE